MKKVTYLALALSLFSGAGFAGFKEDQHQQMISLAQEMRQLKASGQADSPGYAVLSAQYDQISAAMGGDDPGRTLPDGQPAINGLGEAPEGGAIGVVPNPPVGCTGTTTVTTNSTPVPIPAGPAVVSSTLLVGGQGTFLFDVNLRTFITHTFSADLDITLMSPAGTVVTLTTDNGGGNDNNYNGTAWDDDANPLGQVPYATNNGLATDHLYANLVAATPLVPEETMGAFIGEDPNGTWTITISDDLGGDSGSLASWDLELTTFTSPPAVLTFSATQATPTPIPAGPAVVSSTVVMAGAGTYLFDVDLTTTITHTFSADLDITLMSPAGTVVTLTTDNGGGNDNNYNGTVWNDDANPLGQVPYTTNNGLATDHLYANLVTATPLAPEEAMAAFIGEDPNGTWTITISDDLGGDSGSLASWTLDIDTATCSCNIVCPLDVTVSNDPNQCGAVVSYPPPTGSCTAVVCSPASGSFFPVGTTPTICDDPQAISSCTFNVTVNDTQPPQITCPADINQDLPPGDPSGPVSYPPPTFSDNCPGDTASCVPPSGSTFTAGTTPVTCTDTDASGNTATCTFNVTLNLVSILEIPTVSTWGLAALALLLAAVALLLFRRRA